MNSPDTFTAPEDQAAEALERAHAAGPSTFQGKELWPLGVNTRIWYKQTLGAEDLKSWRALVFVFIHLKRGGKTVQEDVATIMPTLLSPAMLHIVLAGWRQELSGGDFAKDDAVVEEAKLIQEAAFALVEKAQIVISDPESGSKS